MGKKILFTALSIFLTYQAYKLTTAFFELPPERFSGLAKIVSAIAFPLLITGAVAFLGFVYPTGRLLPDSYYQIKNPKKLDVWYKWLGVEFFRFFLLKTFYRKKDNKKYFNGTKSGVVLFDYNTKQSEFGHLIAFIFVFVLSLALLFEGHVVVSIWMQPLNIILNFYPIILQRKHRIIVERLIKRMEIKS